jgi:hypothetical protein
MSDTTKKSGPPVHTVPNPKGGWNNKVAGKVTDSHPTKAAAVEAGKGQAKKTHSEHTIHNLDGKIGEKNSYGNDPCPPKDKR